MPWSLYKVWKGTFHLKLMHRRWVGRPWFWRYSCQIATHWSPVEGTIHSKSSPLLHDLTWDVKAPGYIQTDKPLPYCNQGRGVQNSRLASCSVTTARAAMFGPIASNLPIVCGVGVVTCTSSTCLAHALHRVA
jgi:hypothetical protein